jgi:uncharacterized protein GlcG (DUF336 family)
MNVDLKSAKSLIDTLFAEADKLKKPVSAVVVDSAGFTIAQLRMDGARPLTPGIAFAKAYSAVVMRRPTILLGSLCKAKPEFFAQLSTLAGHPIMAEPGGMPVCKDGDIIGAIGVSGATGEEDQQICETTIRKHGYDLEAVPWNTAHR